ncbi:hypothetical protein HKCCSP123_04545 [Rhodobacterales bacterium HKCCSP123]|nr:hypothetical protein [Rhodobacterales bacterium HKCCSP123]
MLVRTLRPFPVAGILQRRDFLTGAAAAAFAAPRFAFAQTSLQQRLAGGMPPLVIAHRARVGRAPSNSLAGIQNAIDAGIDMVEVDVQVTRGGDHILMHDPTLSTTTNVRDVFPDGAPSLETGDPAARRHLIADYTPGDISQLRLNDREGGVHRIPTLRDALDLAENNLLMILDLKIWNKDTLVPLLQSRPTENLLLFTTASESQLLETAEATGIGVFIDLEEFTSTGRAFDRSVDRYASRLKMVSVGPDQFTPEVRERAEEHEVAVCINGFSLDDAAQLGSDYSPWARALAVGADAYMTRLPMVVQDLLRR